MDETALRLLKRSELQALAKKHGIKASIKSSDIISQLLEHHKIPTVAAKSTLSTTKKKKRKTRKESIVNKNRNSSPISKTRRHTSRTVSPKRALLSRKCTTPPRPFGSSDTPPGEPLPPIPPQILPNGEENPILKTEWTPGPLFPEPADPDLIMHMLDMIQAASQQEHVIQQELTALRRTIAPLHQQIDQMRDVLRGERGSVARMDAYYRYWNPEKKGFTFNDVWSGKLRVRYLPRPGTDREVQWEEISDEEEGSSKHTDLQLISTLQPGQEETAELRKQQDELYAAANERMAREAERLRKRRERDQQLNWESWDANKRHDTEGEDEDDWIRRFPPHTFSPESDHSHGRSVNLKRRRETETDDESEEQDASRHRSRRRPASPAPPPVATRRSARSRQPSANPPSAGQNKESTERGKDKGKSKSKGKSKMTIADVEAMEREQNVLDILEALLYTAFPDASEHTFTDLVATAFPDGFAAATAHDLMSAISSVCHDEKSPTTALANLTFTVNSILPHASTSATVEELMAAVTATFPGGIDVTAVKEYIDRQSK